MKRAHLAALGTVSALAVMLVGVQVGNALLAGPDYLTVTAGSATSQGSNLAILTATTNGDIPRRADEFINENPATAFAWADPVTHQAFVAAIHPSFDDSAQNPSGWHAHTATLAAGATAPHDFCIASIDSTPTAGISINGDTITVHAQVSKLPVAPEDIHHVVGFTIQGDGACTATGLAVQVTAAPVEIN